jgi:hypothetical protein
LDGFDGGADGHGGSLPDGPQLNYQWE